MSHDAGHHEEAHHEPTGYGMYFVTWFALIFLTAITVTAAGLHLGNAGVLVALLIATVKASMVGPETADTLTPTPLAVE